MVLLVLVKIFDIFRKLILHSFYPIVVDSSTVLGECWGIAFVDGSVWSCVGIIRAFRLRFHTATLGLSQHLHSLFRIQRSEDPAFSDHSHSWPVGRCCDFFSFLAQVAD